MKVTKTISLELETVNELEKLIETKKIKTLSSFIQSAIDEKLKTKDNETN